MELRKYISISCLLVVLFAGAFGVAPAWSQKKTSPQPQAAAPAQPDKVWIKDPKSVMPMRQMTAAQHRQAASRNATRRARVQRKLNIPVHQGVRP